MAFRIHPEMAFATVPQVTPTEQAKGRFFATCVGTRYMCPFDQDALAADHRFCRTMCFYRKRGEE